MAPLLPLASGEWQHAIEFRFLPSADSLLPPDGQLTEGKRAIFLDVPLGQMLILNLLISTPGAQPTGVPPEFVPGGEVLWRRPLKDYRSVILVGRVRAMEQTNLDEIGYIRNELGIQQTVYEPLRGDEYIEPFRVTWTAEGGNIVLVVPLGPDAFRVHLDEPGDVAQVGTAFARPLALASGGAQIQIHAPNGAPIGELLIPDMEENIVIHKNVRCRHPLGRFSLRLDPANLVDGGSFELPSMDISVAPTVWGAQPTNWCYRAQCRFDGEVLTVKVNEMSAALRIAHQRLLREILQDGEELLIAAPVDGVRLSTSVTSPKASEMAYLQILLRDTSS